MQRKWDFSIFHVSLSAISRYSTSAQGKEHFAQELSSKHIFSLPCPLPATLPPPLFFYVGRKERKKPV